MRPDDLARFSVEQLKLHGHQSVDTPSVNFLESIESAPNHKLSFGPTPWSGHRLIVPRGTEHPNQLAVEHFHRRFSPPTVMVSANLIGADAVRNRRVAKDLRPADAG